jgi:hypothetical protein
MSKTTRRDFIKTGTAATAMSALSYSRVLGANGKVRTAIVSARVIA